MTEEEGRKLLARLQELQALLQQRFDPAYQAWLNRMATLSPGLLALLVGLQNTYVPRSPEGRWLLIVCWCCLSAATFLVLLALYGEAQSHREAGRAFQKSMRELRAAIPPSDQVLALGKLLDGFFYKRPKRFLWCAAMAAACLSVAMVSLAAFASLNLW